MNLIILQFLALLSIVSTVFFYFKSKRHAVLHENLLREHSSTTKTCQELENRIKFIINAFSSPALIINNKGVISFANEETKKLLSFTEIEGRIYLEFFKEPEFINGVQSFHRDIRPVEKEVVLNGRTFRTFFHPIGETGDIFISFNDVTAERELIHIKQELVTNMSHELKTPLTAIKGYVETLQEEIPPQLRNHFDVVRKHTDRLINILNDILSLSKFEEIQKVEFEPVNIKEIIEETVKMFAARIKDKNLSIAINIDKESLSIEGNRSKIEELFINIIDNAIRYTDKGSITIKSFRDKNSVIIEIKDTGIGIPERHLARIFERFYVVDKSRSKETGGTGLGLSIVKHIVRLHRGDINIKSRVGTGTEVLISLPLAQTAT